jgi:cytochrome oxidase Cu insertion factor (SCO1/SenC/PrrC family)
MKNRIAHTALAVMMLVAGAAAQTQSAKAETTPEPKIKVGDTAPDFTLLDQNRKPVKLSDFRGKKSVVLAFYIFAFTGG